MYEHEHKDRHERDAEYAAKYQNGTCAYIFEESGPGEDEELCGKPAVKTVRPCPHRTCARHFCEKHAERMVKTFPQYKMKQKLMAAMMEGIIMNPDMPKPPGWSDADIQHAQEEFLKFKQEAEEMECVVEDLNTGISELEAQEAATQINSMASLPAWLTGGSLN